MVANTGLRLTEPLAPIIQGFRNREEVEPNRTRMYGGKPVFRTDVASGSRPGVCLSHLACEATTFKVLKLFGVS